MSACGRESHFDSSFSQSIRSPERASSPSILEGCSYTSPQQQAQQQQLLQQGPNMELEKAVRDILTEELLVGSMSALCKLVN